MSTTRRVFLRNSALAVVGTAAVPSFLARAALGAAQPGVRTKRLVVIFHARRRRRLEHRRSLTPSRNITPCGRASIFHARPCSISMDFLACTLRSHLSSRSGSNVNSRLCTPPDRLTPAAPTSMRRISWRPALRASSPQKMDGSTARCATCRIRRRKRRSRPSPWVRRSRAF